MAKNTSERAGRFKRSMLQSNTPGMSVRQLMAALQVSHSKARQLLAEVRRHLANGEHE